MGSKDRALLKNTVFVPLGALTLAALLILWRAAVNSGNTLDVGTGSGVYFSQTTSQFKAELMRKMVAGGIDHEGSRMILHSLAASTLLLNGTRKSGRQYSEHHMGVASCLLQLDYPPVVVAAALLHSVYVFGTPMYEQPAALVSDICYIRNYVAGLVGVEVEHFVWGVTTFPNINADDQGIRRLLHGIDEDLMDDFQRLLAAIHICNEVDEHSDREQWWGHNRQRTRKRQSDMLYLAKRLVGPKMESWLQSAFAQTNELYNPDSPNEIRNPSSPQAVAVASIANAYAEGLMKANYGPAQVVTAPWLLENVVRPNSEQVVQQWPTFWSKIFHVCCGGGLPGGPCFKAGGGLEK